MSTAVGVRSRAWGVPKGGPARPPSGSTLLLRYDLNLDRLVIGEGNRRYVVTAVIPLPTIGEFVDGATCGLLEVEPL